MADIQNKSDVISAVPMHACGKVVVVISHACANTPPLSLVMN